MGKIVEIILAFVFLILSSISFIKNELVLGILFMLVSLVFVKVWADE